LNLFQTAERKNAGRDVLVPARADLRHLWPA
jgi:hypothetical protein